MSERLTDAIASLRGEFSGLARGEGLTTATAFSIGSTAREVCDVAEQAMACRDTRIAELEAHVAERDEEIESLRAELARALDFLETFISPYRDSAGILRSPCCGARADREWRHAVGCSTAVLLREAGRDV